MYQITVFRLDKQEDSKQLMDAPTRSYHEARRIMFDKIDADRALDLVRSARKEYHGIKLPKIKSILHYNYKSSKDKMLYMIYLHEAES